MSRADAEDRDESSRDDDDEEEGEEEEEEEKADFDADDEKSVQESEKEEESKEEEKEEKEKLQYTYHHLRRIIRISHRFVIEVMYTVTDQIRGTYFAYLHDQRSQRHIPLRLGQQNGHPCLFHDEIYDVIEVASNNDLNSDMTTAQIVAVLQKMHVFGRNNFEAIEKRFSIDITSRQPNLWKDGAHAETKDDAHAETYEFKNVRYVQSPTKMNDAFCLEYVERMPLNVSILRRNHADLGDTISLVTKQFDQYDLYIHSFRAVPEEEDGEQGYWTMEDFRIFTEFCKCIRLASARIRLIRYCIGMQSIFPSYVLLSVIEFTHEFDDVYNHRRLIEQIIKVNDARLRWARDEGDDEEEEEEEEENRKGIRDKTAREQDLSIVRATKRIKTA